MSDFQTQGKYVVFTIESDLATEDAAADLKESLEVLVEKENRDILLDFSNVKNINSAGIGKLLLAYKKLKTQNRNIAVVNISEFLSKLFEKLMFSRLFKIYKNMSEVTQSE